MDIWADKVSSILEENNINIYLPAKYVDDVNIATSLVLEGCMWTKAERKCILQYSDEQQEIDRKEARTPQECNMEKILWIGNTQIPRIKLTRGRSLWMET